MGRVLGWGVFIVLVLGAVGMFTAGRPPTTGQGSAAHIETVATIDKSAAMQRDRKALIDKLIAEQVFLKVEMRGLAPRVWVLPRFAQATFDQKQSFISAVYAYYFDGSSVSDFVRVIDGMTGNEIGQFAPASGGLRLNH